MPYVGVRRWALWSGAAAPVVLVATMIAANVLISEDYSAVRQTISDLATIDGGGWVMGVGIGLSGALSVVTSLGLVGVRRLARLTLGAAGSCGVLVALIPVNVNQPLHLLFAAGNLGLFALWPILSATRSPIAPVTLRPATAIAATTTVFALLGWTLIETQGGGELGIAERFSVTANLIWPLVVAIDFTRRRRAGPD